MGRRREEDTAPKEPLARVPAILALLLLVGLFVALAVPRRWFNDDAFITFRYSEHLASGHGFVWNVAPPLPVEGTTSLGWTLLNAVAIRFGVHPTPFSHLLGLVAGAAGLLLVGWAARRLLGLPRAWALVAPALLVAHRQYVLWSVSAMEIVAAAVVAIGATALLARELERGRGWWWSGLAFFGATLLRPETPLLHLAAGLGLLLARPGLRTARQIVLSGGLHAALLALLSGWRLLTFGKPLPNTFYAKVGALQTDRGLDYLAQFLAQYHVWLWGPILLIGVVLMIKRRQVFAAALAVQVALVAAWIVASGGGRWEFRYFVPILPAWAVLVAGSLYAFSRGYQLDAEPTRRRRTVIGVLAVAVIVTQAATLFTPFRRFDLMMKTEELHAAARAMLDEGRLLATVLGPDDRIAIGWAGAVPYLTGAWHFDPWGLNHPDVEEWPFREEGVIFHQRHATWDDMAAADVMFVDLFNGFLRTRPLPPERLVGSGLLQPWAREGILVHCYELPVEDDHRYWIFASPRPPAEVEAWAEAKGLDRCYTRQLRFGRPTTLSAPPPPRRF
jgi:hypothetical protein